MRRREARRRLRHALAVAALICAAALGIALTLFAVSI